MTGNNSEQDSIQQDEEIIVVNEETGDKFSSIEEYQEYQEEQGQKAEFVTEVKELLENTYGMDIEKLEENHHTSIEDLIEEVMASPDAITSSYSASVKVATGELLQLIGNHWVNGQFSPE